MSRVVESPAHRQVRATLTNLARKVNSLRVDEFDLQQLKNLNIHVDLITLDETSPHKLSYFAPYPGHSVPEPNNDDLGGAYNGLDDETEHSLTRPADHAYVMYIHLSSYISYYDLNAKGERALGLQNVLENPHLRTQACISMTSPSSGAIISRS